MNNTSRGSSMLIGFAGLAIMLYVLSSVLLTDGNLVGNLCKYLLVAGFVFGLMAPRGTFIVWLIGCGYLDLLKRLMIVSGRMFQDDLFYVLGVAPATFGGIVGGVMMMAFFGKLRLTSRHLGFLVAAASVVVLSALMSLRTGGASLRTLGPDVANAGLYALMLFVIPVLFPDRASVMRLLRLLLIAWLPVAVYGVYQQTHGFQEFEIDYLKTGLSIEIKQLFSDRVRAFSTLNSPTALGTISGGLCAVALILGIKPTPQRGSRMFPLFIALLISLCYGAAMMASTVRTSLMIPIIGLAAAWAFRYRGVTWFLYTSLTLMFALLVLSADFILNRISIWNDLATDNLIARAFGQELTSIGTFSDRLMGFRNILMNPDAYTLFGYGAERGSDPTDPLYNHDLLSNMIVRHGCVPLVLFGLVGFIVLRRLHAAVHRLSVPDDRRLAAAALGISLAIFGASMLSGNVLATFPNNVFFWLLQGVTVMLAFSGEKKAAPARQPMPPSALADSQRFPLRSPQRSGTA